MLRLLGWLASARDQQAVGNPVQSVSEAGFSSAPQRRKPKLFPSAAQPDIVRAAQKDELYLQHLADACQDAVRRFLGPRWALHHARETRLVAELLYHGLTTGAGVQTLGEEYCDVLQVTGPVGVAPGRAQRMLLVLLQTLVPYLAQRVAAATAASALQAEGERQAAAAPGSSPDPSLLAAAAERRQGAPQAGFADPAADSPEQASRLGAAHESGAAPAGAWAPAAGSRVYRASALGSRVSFAAAAEARRAWAALSGYAPEAVRLHLALFYFFGVYYHWAKRATGTRYIFTGKLFERRPSYHLLGALLFLQLGISAAGWGLARLQASVAGGPPPGAGAAARGPEASERKGGPAVLLQEDGSEAETAAPAALGAGAEWADVPQKRRCALCLGARDVPTAVPCGHVFCWACIAAWHNQKPECPLCRAPFGTAGLVCVYNGDF